MKFPKPFIFISGLKSEFGKIRSELKRNLKLYSDIDVLIFEELEIPGSVQIEHECETWGRECDLFIIIAGKRYGNISKIRGISFTELEYDAAFSSDPDKVLSYVQSATRREPKQQDFIQKIGESRRYKEFKLTAELHELIPIAIKEKLTNTRVKLSSNDIKVTGIFDSSGFRIRITNYCSSDIFMKEPFVLDGTPYKNGWEARNRIPAGGSGESHKIQKYFNEMKNIGEKAGKFTMTTNLKLNLEFENELYSIDCIINQIGEKMTTSIESISLDRD